MTYLSTSNPYAVGLARLQARRAARTSRRIPYIEEEALQQSLMRRVGGMGVSAAATAGHFLDTPGSRIRGGLADLTGVARTPGERIYGRDLLEGWGVIGRNTPGFDLGDVAGFGLDVVLDPLTYLTGGGAAVGKGGKVLKAMGKFPGKSLVNPLTGKLTLGKRLARLTETPSTVLKRAAEESAKSGGKSAAQMFNDFSTQFEQLAAKKGYDAAKIMDEPLGGMIGLRVPFTDIGTTFGRGPWAQQIAHGLDVAGASARYSRLGRAAAGLFHYPTAGTTGIAAQSHVAPAALETLEQTRAQTIGTTLGQSRRLAEAGLDTADGRAALTRYMEFPNQPVSHPIIKEIGDEIRAANKLQIDRQIRAGLDPKQLDDLYAELSHRELAKERIVAKAADKLPPALARRDPYTQTSRTLRDFKAGTEGIEQAALDPMINSTSSLARKDRLAIMEEKYMGLSAAKKARVDALKQSIDAMDKKVAGGGALTQAEQTLYDLMTAEVEHSTRLMQSAEIATDTIHNLKPGPTVYSNDPISANARANLYGDVVTQNANNLTRLAGMTVNMTGEYGVIDAMRRLGLNATARDGTATNLIPQLARKIAAGADDVMKDQLAPLIGLTKAELKDLDVVEAATQALMRDVAEASKLKTAFNDIFRLSRETVDDATRLNNFFVNPESDNELIKATDVVTNMFKTGVTSWFPGFHVRNFFTELWQHFVAGAYDPTVARGLRYLKPWQDAIKMASGKPVKDAHLLPGLSNLPSVRRALATSKEAADIEATKLIAERAVGERLTGAGRISEVLGEKGDAAFQIGREAVPGVGGFFGDVKRAVKNRSYNPLMNRGVLPSATETGREFLPTGLGRAAGNMVDTTARLATMIGFMRQGMDISTAAMKSRLAHVDYMRLTPFERQYMRRLAPFYSWTRGMAPWQFKHLAEYPGGGSAQAIRAATQARSDDYVPEWVAGGLAVEMSPDAEGNRQYLTGLDLPHEAVMEPMMLGSDALRNTGRGYLGMLNPLIKGPLEYFADSSFFRRGQKLSELDPTLGRTVSNVGEMMGYEINPRFLRSYRGGDLAEQVLANSPLARVLTTTRGLTDPRKSLGTKAFNFLTGGRVTSVEPQAEERNILNLIEENVRGKPGVGTFSTIYSKNLADLDPETLQLMMLYETIRKQQRERKKQSGGKKK